MEVDLRHGGGRVVGGGGRSHVRSILLSLGNICSHRPYYFTAAIFVLLFTAALLVMLTSGGNGNAYRKTIFPALNYGHQEKIPLKKAYAAYSRNLKLELSRQLQLYDHLSHYDDDDKKVNDTITVARSIIVEQEEGLRDIKAMIQKLKDTIFATNELVVKAKKMDAFTGRADLDSAPKSLSCFVNRLLEDRNAHPDKYADEEPRPEFQDPSLYHYAMFSNNVIASSVVVNSALKNGRSGALETRFPYSVVAEP